MVRDTVFVDADLAKSASRISGDVRTRFTKCKKKKKKTFRFLKHKFIKIFCLMQDSLLFPDGILVYKTFFACNASKIMPPPSESVQRHQLL